MVPSAGFEPAGLQHYRLMALAVGHLHRI
jgi:hypothetical protein